MRSAATQGCAPSTSSSRTRSRPMAARSLAMRSASARTSPACSGSLLMAGKRTYSVKRASVRSNAASARAATVSAVLMSLVSSVAMSSAHGWLPANEREPIVELHVARLVLAGRAADGDARCDLAQEVAREVIDELLQALAVRYDRRPARGDRRVGHLVIIDDHAAAAPPLGALGLVGDEVSGLD